MSNINYIDLDISSSCNYNCVYCNAPYKNTNKYYTKLDTKSIFEIRNNLKSNILNIIEITGGEPSLIPITILKNLKILNNNFNIKFLMSTNMSQDINYYKQLIDILNIDYIVSIHEETNHPELINKLHSLSNNIKFVRIHNYIDNPLADLYKHFKIDKYEINDINDDNTIYKFEKIYLNFC